MAGGATLKQLAEALNPLRATCRCKAINCPYCILRGENNEGCKKCSVPALGAAACLGCHDK